MLEFAFVVRAVIRVWQQDLRLWRRCDGVTIVDAQGDFGSADGTMESSVFGIRRESTKLFWMKPIGWTPPSLKRGNAAQLAPDLRVAPEGQPTSRQRSRGILTLTGLANRKLRGGPRIDSTARPLPFLVYGLRR